jgi:hypothetical protein
MTSDTTISVVGLRPDRAAAETPVMTRPIAFVTPPYPVLFNVAASGAGGVPSGEAELMLALLISGTPSFLAAHRIPEEAVDDLVVSLQGGDARVAVTGSWIEAGGGMRGRVERRPAAVIGLVCTDGRRITLARVVAEDPEGSLELLARHVVRQIARGVQVPDLVGR